MSFLNPGSIVNFNFLPSVLVQRFAGHTGLKKIISNISWLFFEKFFNMGLGLIIGIFVARYLGPDRFGLLNYAMAFVALFTPLAGLGLDSVVVREIIAKPDATGALLGTSFYLKLGGSFLLVVFAGIAQYFLDPKDPVSLYLVIIIAGGAVFQSFGTIDFWFRAQVLSKYTVIANNIAALIASLFRLALVFLGAGLLFFGFAISFNFLLAAVGMVIAYRIYGGRFAAWKFEFSQVRTLLKDGWPLALQSLMVMVYMRIDQVMLKTMTNNYEVGIYSAAVRLTEIWYVVPMVVCQTLLPAIIRAKQMDKTIYLNRIQYLYNLLLWMAIGIAIIVTFSSGFIVSTLLGAQYVKSANIFAIQIWLGCWVFLNVARQQWILAENKLIIALYSEIVATSLNVAANLILIPKYGAFGAVVASLFAATITNFIMALFSETIRFSLMMYFKSLISPVTFIWGKCVERDL
ncbi:MAG: flippase [Desulfosalsimonadaceae bacterium]